MRELVETPGERIVGFVDDNPQLRRRRLRGVPVLGGSHEIERILDRAEPDVVLVTIPDASRDRLEQIVAACDERGIACRFVRREVDLDPQVILGTTS
jgi:FlaA1/EpsC-like NDP-sugar epimerase